MREQTFVLNLKPKRILTPMKFKIVYTLATILLLGILFYNNSAGPANVQGNDRTGSPLSVGPCQVCHSAGAFSPELTLELLDNNTPVTGYEPGRLYRLRATINATGNPTAYGFQTVALRGDDDLNAGTFGDPPTGMNVVELNERDYAEQSFPNPNNTFEIEWTAPESGSGEVRFYAACVATNGNGSSGGDGSSFLTEPLILDEVLSSVSIVDKPFVDLKVYPNPVEEDLVLSVTSGASGTYQMNIFDAQGRLMESEKLSLVSGNNRRVFDVSNFPIGIYSLQLTDGVESSSTYLVKQ